MKYITKITVFMIAVFLIFQSTLISVTAEDSIFLCETPPSPPKENINLIETSSSLSDTSSGALDLFYNKVTHTIENAVDLKNGFLKFEKIKGLKMSDTYLFSMKLNIKTAQPNLEYKDSTSQGVRIIFRGNDNSNYCFFSLFSNAAVYYSYIGNSMLSNRSVKFKRELSREYDIKILSAPNELSVWVDGELILHETNVPQFEPYIGFQIYRSSAKISDISVYNMENDDGDIIASEKKTDVYTDYKEFEGEEGKLPITSNGSKTMVIVGIAVSSVAFVLLIVTIVFGIKAKRRKKTNEF